MSEESEESDAAVGSNSSHLRRVLHFIRIIEFKPRIPSECIIIPILQTLFSWAPWSLQTVTAAMKLKDTCSLEEVMKNIVY